MEKTFTETLTEQIYAIRARGFAVTRITISDKIAEKLRRAYCVHWKFIADDSIEAAVTRVMGISVVVRADLPGDMCIIETAQNRAAAVIAPYYKFCPHCGERLKE